MEDNIYIKKVIKKLKRMYKKTKTRLCKVWLIDSINEISNKHRDMEEKLELAIVADDFWFDN